MKKEQYTGEDIIIYTIGKFNNYDIYSQKILISNLLYFVKNACQQYLPFKFKVVSHHIESPDIFNIVNKLKKSNEYCIEDILIIKKRLPIKLRNAIDISFKCLDEHSPLGIFYMSYMLWIKKHYKISNKLKCINKFKTLIAPIKDKIEEDTYSYFHDYLLEVMELFKSKR